MTHPVARLIPWPACPPSSMEKGGDLLAGPVSVPAPAQPRGLKDLPQQLPVFRAVPLLSITRRTCWERAESQNPLPSTSGSGKDGIYKRDVSLCQLFPRRRSFQDKAACGQLSQVTSNISTCYA